MADFFSHLSFGALTDVGVKRKNNEDSIVTLPEHGVYCVADGMGGAQGGEIASQAAVMCLKKAFHSLSSPLSAASAQGKARVIEKALNQASRWIKQRSDRKGINGAGTTAVVIAFDARTPRKAIILHAGDSRAYRFRGDRLTQLSKDHTVAAAAGLSDESALPSMFKGVVTRAVGVKARVELEHTLVEVNTNDIYLLSSDGLDKLVSDPDIERLIREEGQGDLDALSKKFVDLTNSRGGVDNVSVILVRVGEAAPPSEPIPPDAEDELAEISVYDFDTNESSTSDRTSPTPSTGVIQSYSDEFDFGERELVGSTPSRNSHTDESHDLSQSNLRGQKNTKSSRHWPTQSTLILILSVVILLLLFISVLFMRTGQNQKRHLGFNEGIEDFGHNDPPTEPAEGRREVNNPVEENDRDADAILAEIESSLGVARETESRARDSSKDESQQPTLTQLEQTRLEQERVARAKAEQERLERERLAAEQERLERERLEKARLEQERVARAKAEQKKLERERLAVEQARLEEDWAKVEQKRLEREGLAAEQERIERERLEQERLEDQRVAGAKAEQERLEREGLAAEQERLERERLEQERLEGERVARAKAEQERLERERLAAEQAQQLHRARQEFYQRFTDTLISGSWGKLEKYVNALNELYKNFEYSSGRELEFRAWLGVWKDAESRQSTLGTELAFVYQSVADVCSRAGFETPPDVSIFTGDVSEKADQYCARRYELGQAFTETVQNFVSKSRQQIGLFLPRSEETLENIWRIAGESDVSDAFALARKLKEIQSVLHEVEEWIDALPVGPISTEVLATAPVDQMSETVSFLDRLWEKIYVVAYDLPQQLAVWRNWEDEVIAPLLNEVEDFQYGLVLDREEFGESKMQVWRLKGNQTNLAALIRSINRVYPLLREKTEDAAR